MSRLRVHSFTVSIDGFGAGPNQDLLNPLGVRGPELFDWFFRTRTFRGCMGEADGETGADDAIAAKGFEGFGRVDPGPEHVRPDSRPVAGRELEGLVGRRAAVPRARLRPDAARSGPDSR